MIRPHLFLHPAREPAPAIPAVTLILLRDVPAQGGQMQSGQMQVLLSRRAMDARFAPGAYVFPGGVVDAQDAATASHAQTRAGQDAHAQTLAAAAVRESWEELGIVLAVDAQGQPVSPQQAAQLERQRPLPAQLQAKGWRMALDGIFQFAHWVTDLDYPRRYDVPFLVARAPAGQEPVADGQEQFDPLWLTPAQALQRHARGKLHLLPPTLRTLERLQAFPHVDAVLQACAQAPALPRSCMRGGYHQGQEVRLMEHDLAYAELALVCPQGQLAHDITWQHDRPVPLLRHLQRLTAPNRSVMTGPGTNTYLVGQAQTGYIVLDPGPWGNACDAQHLQRIMQATGGDIRHIVCTHSHPDHSPAAAPLQALVEAAGKPRPPIWGMPSAPTARAQDHFRPDRTLMHGDVVAVSAKTNALANPNATPSTTSYGKPGVPATDSAHRHSLRAIHTPGHAANHLCFLLEEDALLFCGDHILSGSTTVIIPPDGNMSDYLASLDVLQHLCEERQVPFMLPAHGHVLGQPAATIGQLRAHRLAREEKVWQAMQTHPQGNVQDWLAHAYADVPQAVWLVARYSLQAHAERLATLHPAYAPQVQANFPPVSAALITAPTTAPTAEPTANQ